MLKRLRKLPPTDKELELIASVEAKFGSIELEFDCTTSLYGDFYDQFKKKEKSVSDCSCICLLCYFKTKEVNELKFTSANIRSHIIEMHQDVFKNDNLWVEKCTLIKEKFVNKVFKIRNRKQKRHSHKIEIEKPQE